jgi:GNAT superfamily N-acetyltransferase
MLGIRIRRYNKKDRQTVRDICWETAFLGKPADAFFQDREILCDFLTAYFTDYEPQGAFVADAGGKVVGYLISVRDVKVMERKLKRVLLPKLILKAVIRGTLFHLKNLGFIVRCIISLMRGEFRSVDISESPVATFHINLRAGHRGEGIGAKLLHAFEFYLRQARVPEVVASTASAEAGKFFMRHGFRHVVSVERSYWKHLTGKKTKVSLYGKRVLPTEGSAVFAQISFPKKKRKRGRGVS